MWNGANQAQECEWEGGGVAGFCRLVQFSVGSVSIQLSSGFQMPFCMSTVFGKWGKEGDGRK